MDEEPVFVWGGIVSNIGGDNNNSSSSNN